MTFVHLHLSREGQLARVENADRANFGKLRDVEILKANLDQFEASTRAMPAADITIETEQMSAYDAAELIVKTLDLA
ncbi:MAG: hypothetical protein VXW22_15020 [Pseudomonadota bacterium]|nr:hypothetical protein [Pseudomonadota bacterium]